MARKTKYTPDTVSTIMQAISIGGSDKDACELSGIDQATFYRWLHEKQEFSEQVTRARVQGKLGRIGRIKKHGENDWRADAWYLERRWPEEYAQQLIVKVTTEQAAVLKRYGLTAADAFEQLIQSLAVSDAKAE
jgi:hypothetical protein